MATLGIFGPRWLDKVRAGTIAASTLVIYRQAVLRFVNWLDEKQWVPEFAEEYDDLLVEWSLDEYEQIKLGLFRSAVAGVEFFFPNIRDRLSWTHRRLESWKNATPIRHTVPGCWEALLLIATSIASLGRPRLALGVLIQYALCLRPSELLALTTDDIACGPERISKGVIIIRLGFRSGTKSGREQFALLRISEFPRLWILFKRVIDLTPSGHRLFFFTVSTVNHWYRKAQDSLNLDLGLTAHSPRAGRASDLIADGVSPVLVKEAGRWISESSFRTYVDCIGAQFVAQKLLLGGWGEIVNWLIDQFTEYFSVEALDNYGIFLRRRTDDSQPKAATTHRFRGRGAASGKGRSRGQGQGRGRQSAVDRAGRLPRHQGVGRGRIATAAKGQGRTGSAPSS